MGIKSTQNWSGTVVNGVLLGEPAFNETTLVYEWDGGVPNGTLDAVGMFQPEGTTEAGQPFTKVNLEDISDVVYKTAKLTEVGALDEVFAKGDVIERDGVLYVCNKDALTVLPPHKDWLVVKAKVVK